MLFLAWVINKNLRDSLSVTPCMSGLDYEKKYLTRSKVGYSPFPNFGTKYSNSFFPYMAKLWNNLSVSTQVLMLPDFKLQLKKDLKPMRYRHFSKGSKIGNSLLTRIRLNRSNLNLHRFDIGLHDSPECQWFAKSESSSHFIIGWFLYSGEHQTLFTLVEHYIPKFSKFSKKKKFDILLMGICPENNEFITTNVKISIAVQKFMLKIKRFHEIDASSPPTPSL